MSEGEDDLPPPLEDCSDLLKSRKERYRDTYHPSSIHSTLTLNRQSPFIHSNGDEAKSNNKNGKKVKSKSNALKSGFLLSKKPKSKKKNKNKSTKGNKLQSKTKPNPLIIEEAQNKLNQTPSYIHSYILYVSSLILLDAKMAQMAHELHKDKDLWNAMLSPSFGTAMNELSTNPHEALKKYQNDPTILPMLSKMVKKMYGKTLPSISKDIHSQIQKQKEAKGDNQQFLESLKIFKS